MINLINLINTTLLTCGLGINVNRNTGLPKLQPRQEQYEQEYTLTLTEDTSVYSDNTVYINSTYNASRRTTKKRAYTQNVAMQVRTTDYTQTLNINNYPDQYINRLSIFKTENTTSTWLNYYNNLLIIQIDPNQVNISTETTYNISFRISVSMEPYANSRYFDIISSYINTQVVTTTENFSGFMNLTNFGTNPIDYIRNQMIGPNSSYRYGLREINTNMTITDNSPNRPDPLNVEITIPLVITPESTNYFCIYNTPILNMYDDSLYSEIDLMNGLGYATCEYMEIRTSNISISGTYVVPMGQIEVVDIPGLMYEIITMPFAFISVAFNLTLFPGTPYQLNISNLILSIFGIMVFIWLIGILLKLKFGGIGALGKGKDVGTPKEEVVSSSESTSE